MKKLTLFSLLFVVLFSSQYTFSAIDTLSIAQAIEDQNADYVPDRLGDTVTVSGIIISPNYQTSHNSFYLQDGSSGVDIFMYGPPKFNWALGDSLTVTGTVEQYNGMTEIVALDSASWDSVSSGNPVPDPIYLTLGQYKASPEMYEGTLIGFIGLSKVSGTWPASGSANLSLSDGVDTVVFRIDSDTDIDGQTEPTWPQNVIGIGSQYDNSAPYDGGYQIFPRYYSTDFQQGPAILTIAEAIEDLNSDYVPDRDGDTVIVSGVITSPNYQTSHNSFYLQDATAGVDVFMYGPPVFTWALGDSLTVVGTVTQYNGMTEINPLDSAYWHYHSSGNTVPNPTVLTLAQYIANPEMYEGSLIGFVGLSLVGGTWPASGSANLSLSDGVDTVVFRIDSDTDIDGQTEPSWPVDVIGIGSQYDNSAPYDGGYQIFPRYYATDFLPAGTIPVELTSFTAKVSGNVVNLSWSTATETNNLGFEIQRKTSDQFITVGFVDGHGTSTEIHNYSYTDSKVESGKYYYRLKQTDLDGTYEYSKVVEAEILKPVKFALDQNYPNPFNPTTMINVNLATDSRVKLVVFDILGQEVATLLNGNLTAGLHQIEFNASNLNSGVYFYRVDATGVDGTNFSSVKKMILTK